MQHRAVGGADRKAGAVRGGEAGQPHRAAAGRAEHQILMGAGAARGDAGLGRAGAPGQFLAAGHGEGGAVLENGGGGAQAVQPGEVHFQGRVGDLRRIGGEVAIDVDGAAAAADHAVRLIHGGVVEAGGQAGGGRGGGGLAEQLGKEQVLAFAGLAEAGGFGGVIDDAGDLLGAARTVILVVAVRFPPHIPAAIDDVVFLDHVGPVMCGVVWRDPHGPAHQLRAHIGGFRVGGVVDGDQGLRIVHTAGAAGLAPVVHLLRLRGILAVIVDIGEFADHAAIGHGARDVPLKGAVAGVVCRPGAGEAAQRAVAVQGGGAVGAERGEGAGAGCGGADRGGVEADEGVLGEGVLGDIVLGAHPAGAGGGGGAVGGGRGCHQPDQAAALCGEVEIDAGIGADGDQGGGVGGGAAADIEEIRRRAAAVGDLELNAVAVENIAGAAALALPGERDIGGGGAGGAQRGHLAIDGTAHGDLGLLAVSCGDTSGDQHVGGAAAAHAAPAQHDPAFAAAGAAAGGGEGEGAVITGGEVPDMGLRGGDQPCRGAGASMQNRAAFWQGLAQAQHIGAGVGQHGRGEATAVFDEVAVAEIGVSAGFDGGVRHAVALVEPQEQIGRRGAGGVARGDAEAWRAPAMDGAGAAAMFEHIVERGEGPDRVGAAFDLHAGAVRIAGNGKGRRDHGRGVEAPDLEDVVVGLAQGERHAAPVMQLHDIEDIIGGVAVIGLARHLGAPAFALQQQAAPARAQLGPDDVQVVVLGVVIFREIDGIEHHRRLGEAAGAWVEIAEAEAAMADRGDAQAHRGEARAVQQQIRDGAADQGAALRAGGGGGAIQHHAAGRARPDQAGGGGPGEVAMQLAMAETGKAEMA